MLEDVTDHMCLLCLQMASLSPVDACSAKARVGVELTQMYPCNYPGCFHSFHLRNTLVRHQRLKHGSPRCRPVYSRRSWKQSDKPFSCHYPGCNRSYFSNPALQRHLATHTSTTTSDVVEMTTPAYIGVTAAREAAFNRYWSVTDKR